MKFTFVLTALVAVVAAVPVDNTADTIDTADSLDSLDNTDAAALCIHIRDCVDALAPTVKACAKAARDKGKNLKEDAACLKEALDAAVNAVGPTSSDNVFNARSH